MKIIGIDPGYDRLGIAIVEKEKGKKEHLIYSGCFTTSPKDEFYSRLLSVGREISRIIDEYKPEGLAIESLFVTKNQKTAMRVSETRGVIVYEAIKHGLAIFEYTPGEIKIAVTGFGASDKSQITKMIPLLIKMDVSKPKLDDEFDAIAVAITCLAHTR